MLKLFSSLKIKCGITRVWIYTKFIKSVKVQMLKTLTSQQQITLSALLGYVP